MFSAPDEIALHQLRIGDSFMPVWHEPSFSSRAEMKASAIGPFPESQRCTLSSPVLLQIAPLLCPSAGIEIFNFVYILYHKITTVKH